MTKHTNSISFLTILALLTGMAMVAQAGLLESAALAAEVVAGESQPQPALGPTVPPVAPADVPHLPTATGLPDEALSKLDADQLYKLAQRKIDMDGIINPNDPSDTPAVAIVVPVAFFTLVVLLVLLVVGYRSRKDRQVHETLRLMVEKGAEIPAEMLTPRAKKNVDLRRGLLLLFAGIGYMAFIGILSLVEPDAFNGFGVGLIPIFIGIGYLLVWRIGKKGESVS